MAILICGPQADANRAIETQVTAEWPQIRGTLAKKLKQRGVPLHELDDAIGEAAGFLWQSVQRGEAIGFAIWWAVGRYCSGRRFSGDRQPQWDREQQHATRQAWETLLASADEPDGSDWTIVGTDHD